MKSKSELTIIIQLVPASPLCSHMMSERLVLLLSLSLSLSSSLSDVVVAVVAVVVVVGVYCQPVIACLDHFHGNRWLVGFSRSLDTVVSYIRR